MLRPLAIALSLSLCLAACDGGGRAPGRATGAVATQRAAQLERLYADYWEAALARDPLRVSQVGEARYNDRPADTFSAAWQAREEAFAREWLSRAQAIGKDGLSGQDLLNYEIFVRAREQQIAGLRFPAWQLPLEQIGNVAASFATLGAGNSAQPFDSVPDYERWMARAARFPALIDGMIAAMRAGMRDGIVQPRVVMQRVLPQLDAVIADRPEETPFWQPILDVPAGIDVAERQRLAGAFRSLIGEQLLPAYRRLRAFIAEEYLPACRDSVGLSALPDGEAWYAYLVQQATTTRLSPAQIHEIGLAEVARIHAEMREVMRRVGFDGTLPQFFRHLAGDPRFRYASEADMLDAFRALQERAAHNAPRLFSLTPKARLAIRPMDPLLAVSAPGATYLAPPEGGTRPGVFYVNTSNLASRRTWDAEATFLHEAIPGHHVQLGLQQELADLPKFRRFGGETAFIEGWGLYAESLGAEMGFYEDPYQHFGRLQAELWRAIRLVVDTGLHARGWSRERVIDYMRANSATSEAEASTEADRYIAIPAQALAYKIGELRIRELRARAEATLGARFDLRAFHAELLKDGAVPLDVLEAKIDRWLAAAAR